MSLTVSCGGHLPIGYSTSTPSKESDLDGMPKIHVRGPACVHTNRCTGGHKGIGIYTIPLHKRLPVMFTYCNVYYNGVNLDLGFNKSFYDSATAQKIRISQLPPVAISLKYT